MSIMLRGKRRGFTLIELLVVVAIIGILAAIALPKLFSAICTSKVGQVDGVMGSINGSLSMYFADNTGSFPVAASGDVSQWIVPKYMNSRPNAPWSNSTMYHYIGTTSQYTLCVSIDNGTGCDNTATGDEFRYYGSAGGSVGYAATATVAGC